MSAWCIGGLAAQGILALPPAAIVRLPCVYSATCCDTWRAQSAGPTGKREQSCKAVLFLLFAGPRPHPSRTYTEEVLVRVRRLVARVGREPLEGAEGKTVRTRTLSPDALRRARALNSQKKILPQILGSLPEVIRSWCAHHHHHTHHQRFSRSGAQMPGSGALAFTLSTARAVGRPALGSGIRPEAPLAPSLATFDRPAATPGT